MAIHSLTVEAWDAGAGELVVDVRCGGGTYVRAIARDLGRELGSRAHLAALRRLAMGPWTVEEALPLADVTRATGSLRPPAEVLRHLPVLEVDPAAAAALAHGRRSRRRSPGAPGPAGPRGGGRAGGGVRGRTAGGRGGGTRGALGAAGGAGGGAVSCDVVTVGTFDGVHRGHRAVLEEIARRAAASGGRQHPGYLRAAPARGGQPGGRTAAAHDRRREARGGGRSRRWTRWWCSPFTRGAGGAVAGTVRAGGAAGAASTCGNWSSGYDHGFGRGRSGDVELLRRIGREDGFAVDVVPAVTLDGTPVSTTAIRRAVAGGDLDAARAGLGRRYSVTRRGGAGGGAGTAAGRADDEPGAAPPRKLLPPDGVYAARVAWRGERHGGDAEPGPAADVRRGRPDAGGAPVRLRGDLVGETVTVRVRAAASGDVMRFDRVEALRHQLERDRARCAGAR